MKDLLKIIIALIGCFVVGFLFGYDYRNDQIKCRSLQVIDCGHIVHNGDTVRFTTLPVK